MKTSTSRRDFLILTGNGLLTASMSGPLTSIARAAGVTSQIPSNAALETIHNRAVSLLAQLDIGLSYAGQVREWVPRRDISDVVDDAQNLSDLAKQISDSAERLAESQRTVQEEANSAASAHSLAQKQLQDIILSINNLNTEYRSLNNQLAEFDLGVRRTKDAMLKAQDDFKEAVRRGSAKKCGFGEILTAVGALVAIGTGTMTALPAITAAAGQIASAGITWENIRIINNILEPAKKGIDSIVNGYNKIKPLLDEDSKGAMVTVEINELNEHLQSVLKEIDNTKGASKKDKEKFKRAVREFASAVEVRNNAILRLDNIAIRSAELELQRAATDDLIKRFGDHIARVQLLDRKQLSDLMRRVSRNALRKLRDNLWLAQRAFDYSSLRPYSADADISSEDHGLLANALFKTRTDLSNYLTLAPGMAQQYPVSNNQRFIINLPLTEATRQQLRGSGAMFISLHPLFDLPKYYERAVEVYANTVRVRIDKTNSFNGYLTHLRVSRFRRQSGDLIQFQLTPTVLNVGADAVIRLGSEDSTPAGKRYLGLSPFSDWLLNISDPTKISQRAEYIEIEFTGTMRSTA